MPWGTNDEAFNDPQGGQAKRRCVTEDVGGRGGRGETALTAPSASDFSSFNSIVRRQTQEREGASMVVNPDG